MKLAERSSEESESEVSSSLDPRLFPSPEVTDMLSSQSAPLISESSSARSLMCPSKSLAPGVYS